MQQHYEVHVSGLAPYIVPLAFPDSIVLRRGDVSVAVGAFDLEVLSRRIARLGGRVLAVFHAEDQPITGPPRPVA
jgi:hypothetical protein